MKLITRGKTKDVYLKENGNYLLKFKDDVTGVDGVFDPGADQVGLTIEGSGNLGLRMTKFFFDAIKKYDVKTHMVDVDIENNTMEVKKADLFGEGLEVICRYKAVGSFYRRYHKYVEKEQDLDGYVEFTIKDDKAQDPLITKEAMLLLGILKEGEYEELVEKTRTVSQVVKDILKDKGLDLYDIKLEFGHVGRKGEIALIDEISGGNMRVYKDGEYIEPMDLEKYIF